jgi:hypothetical protein
MNEALRIYYRTHVLEFVEFELYETLSPDQKEFLLDIIMRDVKYAIVSSGRGAGKTSILAIIGIFRALCFDSYDISVLSSSEKQSGILRTFINKWTRNSFFLQVEIEKSIQTEILTVHGNRIYLNTLAETSTRGVHSRDLLLDEVSTASSVGADDVIISSIGNISTSPDAHIILCSTSQYVHGEFLRIWQNAEQLGYKRYKWSIAKHENGIEDPSIMQGWTPNFHWIAKQTLDAQRRIYSNDQWLVEVLGGISLKSGLVFQPIDLEFCVCSQCEHCVPNQDCPLFKDKRIVEKRLGIDWGKVEANAYVALGREIDCPDVYILHAEEFFGRSEEAILRASQIYKEYNCDMAFPDIAQYGQNESLENLGVTYALLFTEGGQQKTEYLGNLIRHVERHILHIPKSYEVLINQLKLYSFETKGNRERPRKGFDHSVDAFMYALSEFYEDSEGGFIDFKGFPQFSGSDKPDNPWRIRGEK